MFEENEKSNPEEGIHPMEGKSFGGMHSSLGNESPEKEVLIESPSRLRPLIGVLLVIASIAVYAFFARPLSNRVDDIRADVLDIEQQIADANVKIDQFGRAETQLDLSTEVQRLEILKTVPIEMEQDSVIRDLVDIADTYDIQLKSLSFGKGASGKEGVNVLKINSSFEGDYSDLTRFLQGIEQNSRTFRVNTISVQISSLDVGDIKRATFSLSMEAFYQENNK